MSNITTCAVTGIIHESEGGVPAVGATIEVQLAYYDIYQGFVAPEKTVFKTDENGEVVMNLFPNQLGQAASFYEVRIKTKNKTFKTIAVVPNLPTAFLHEIVDLPPYDGQPTGAIILARIEALLVLYENLIPKFLPNAPPNPLPGAQWTDADTGKTYEWVVTASSSAWFEVGSAETIGYETAIQAAQSAADAADSAADAESAKTDAVAARDVAVPAAATATSQADISTTKAGEAEVSAAAAASSATSSATASDIALARGRTYATPAAGVNPAGTPAGVAFGEYFTVPSATNGLALDLYLNSAGTAVPQVGKSILGTDAALFYRGTTDAGDLNYSSFNSAVKPGYYWNTRIAAQTPLGTVAVTGSLVVQKIGPDKGIQVFYKDGDMVDAWARTFVISTSTFTAWKQVIAFGQLKASMTGQYSDYRGTTTNAVDDPSWGLNISNFNAMLNVGRYENISRVCSNTPYGTVAVAGTVVVECINADTARQTFYKDGALVEVWARSFVVSTSTFSAWKRLFLFGPLSASLFDSKTLYRGSTDTVANDPAYGLNINNFNLLVNEGFYWNTSRACSNTPYGTFAAIGSIEVKGTGPDLAIQTYRKDGLLTEVWSRSFTVSTSTFSAWEQQTSLTQKVTPSRLIDNFPFREEVTARPISTDRDCNKCLLPGNYTFNGLQFCLNTPLGTNAIVGTLTVTIRGTVHEQVFRFSDSPSDYATRTFDSTGTFTPWVRKIDRNAGKKWGALGDSITAGIGAGTLGSYAPIAARYMGVALTNSGYGGASMAYRPGQTAAINDNSAVRLTASLLTLSGMDLITLAYGTNDFGNNVPLGVLGSTNEQDFHGAMAVAYSNIVAAAPNARIVFILPIYRYPQAATNTLGLTLQDYRNAIIAFCASKNITCISLHDKMGWNDGNSTNWLLDDLHPGGNIPYEAMARVVASQVAATW